jgi:isoleucyl-tRNA synthetase
MRALREQVNETIEPFRRDKIIRSSLEADVQIYDLDAILGSFVDADFLAELFIVSRVTMAAEAGIVVKRSDDHKCGRCWRLLPEVPEDGGLCARCNEVVEQMDQPA